jgi:hypothetical protein
VWLGVQSSQLWQVDASFSAPFPDVVAIVTDVGHGGTVFNVVQHLSGCSHLGPFSLRRSAEGRYREHVQREIGRHRSVAFPIAEQ